MEYNPLDGVTFCGASTLDGPGATRDFGMLAMILGMMEQSAVFNSINFNLRSHGLFNGTFNAGAANSTGLGATISSYLCPSDSLRTTLLDGGPNAFAQTSYFPSGGTWNTLAYYAGPNCWNQDIGNGAFDDYTAYPASAFTDGLSSTIHAGESSRLRNDPDWSFNTWSAIGYFGSAAGGATTRPQGFAYEVPKLNAPIMLGDDPQNGSNPAAPGHHLARHVGLQGVAPRPQVPELRPVGLPEHAPRRRQLPLRRRLGPMDQGIDRHRDLPGPRHQGRRRGCQRRRLLIDRSGSPPAYFSFALARSAASARMDSGSLLKRSLHPEQQT